MTQNKKGIFGKLKLVGKRFIKGMMFPTAFYGVLGIFVPSILTSKLIIPSLIRAGIISVGFGFLNDAALKMYDHLLEDQAYATA